MRITCVIGPYLPVPPILGGAIERTFLAQCEEFAARGHNVTMISRRYGDLPHDEIVNGVRHLRIPSFDAPKNKLAYRLLDVIYARRACRALPPSDVTITHSVSLPLLIPKRQAGMICVNVSRFPKGQMGFYRRADRLQAVSKAVADAIAQQTPSMAGRVKIINIPISHAFANAIAPARGPREKRIVFLGRIAREKGVELLVSAFAALAPQFPDWSLEIIGPWEHKAGGDGAEYLSELKALAKDCAERVVFTGPIFDEAALVSRLRGAELFVYPSLAEQGESFGVAPLEAMACGCAVIVSQLACFSDFLRHGINGLAFDHRRNAVQSLTNACAQLMRDETERTNLALAAMNTAKSFTPALIAERMLVDFAELTTPQQLPAESPSRREEAARATAHVR